MWTIHVNYMAIPHMAHNRLHEMCMFHIVGEGGTHNHVTEFIIVVVCDLCCQAHVYVCINEVIVEWYCNYQYSGIPAIISDIMLYART